MEQFQRLLANWCWHSRIPSWAPLPTDGMWSVKSWQSRTCPGESPFSEVHIGWVPIRYKLGFLKTFNREDTPKFLKCTSHMYTSHCHVQVTCIQVTVMWKSRVYKSCTSHMYTSHCYVKVTSLQGMYKSHVYKSLLCESHGPTSHYHVQVMGLQVTVICKSQVCKSL